MCGTHNQELQYSLEVDMNPYILSKMHWIQHETSNQLPPKVPSSVESTIAPMTDDNATTLFLGDLSVICDESKLYEFFRRFGEIESVQLKKSDRDPQRAHLGFGFIKFRNHDSAKRALQEMNGYFFLGRAMRVGWAIDFGKKGFQSLTPSDPKKNQTPQIHVMFVTRELNRRVSELDIGAVFRRYGNLVDIAIKKNAINHEYGVQSGYAFLHFALTREGLRSALTAVEEGNMLVVEGITYRCKATHSMQAQLMSMKHKEDERILWKSIPASMVHTYPNPLDDSTFQTYNPKSCTYSVPSYSYRNGSEYYQKDFSTYHMNPTMSYKDQSYDVFPSTLNDLTSPTFSNDCLNISTNTTNLIYPNSTVNDGPTIYSTISQYVVNDHHLHHLPPEQLSSSLSSSLIHSAYEDLPSMKNK